MASEILIFPHFEIRKKIQIFFNFDINFNYFPVCSEMEDLWEHALTVLDEHDISELYKFRDETGILVKKLNRFTSLKIFSLLHQNGIA